MVVKSEHSPPVMKNNSYFTKADPSAAHSAAMAVIRQMVPNKPDAFFNDMGWQAVLAAR